MARKKKQEEHVNHEAWAIPYADLLTLLLAFFVVMYAISSINEGKYRIMSNALTAAFGGIPRTIKHVQVGNEQLQGAMNDSASAVHSASLGSTAGNDTMRLSSISASMSKPINMRDQAALDQASRQLQGLSDRISKALSPLIDRGLITVRRTELWIEVEINSDILFAPASAGLAAEARETLRTLAQVLADAPNNLRVEGHTDNMPIATAQYPSNWELSAARAASVVHLFASNGIAPNRLAMMGYGEFRPRESNDDAKGRNRNRRVMVVILAESVRDMDPLSQHLLTEGHIGPNPADAATPAPSPAAGARSAPPAGGGR